MAVRTPVGEGWILRTDEASFRSRPGAAAPARLLPSGDPFFLCWGRDRELLVADERRRSELWTSRVWPGALLIDGEIAGVWRRSNANLTINAWRRLTRPQHVAVEAEAAALPLALERSIRVTWED
jgi:hypothetical protein